MFSSMLPVARGVATRETNHVRLISAVTSLMPIQTDVERMNTNVGDEALGI
jgi:hypothetical protein